MKYEIIEKSWSKRRKLDEQVEITDIEFKDFAKVHNHFCKMIVTYSDGKSERLVARVVYSDINQHWIVDGMSVAVRLKDEDEAQ
ncbi:hypothetical protein FLL45_18680 [Aliikangiella marina]|uniref:Uncharacterized protein n=1 Tax=Aliikangiella marina TaxID=1712262 RepID=A0A545T4Y4_9GAMM|nr:hypothetical protein [Aliikangiella marina]TQV72245.1 hypothetical protein FLL45_18680 [Aliikangiella marina]